MASSDFSFARLHEIPTPPHEEGEIKSYEDEVARARTTLSKGGKAIDAYVASASVNQLNILWQESEKAAADPKTKAKWQARINSKLCKRILKSSDHIINHIQLISKLEFKQEIYDKIEKKFLKKRIFALPKDQAEKLDALVIELPKLMFLHKAPPQEICQFISDAESKPALEFRMKFLDILGPESRDLLTPDPLNEKIKICKALMTIVSAKRQGRSLEELTSAVIEYMKIHHIDEKYAEFICTQFKNRGEVTVEQGYQLLLKIMQQIAPPVKPALTVSIPAESEDKEREFEKVKFGAEVSRIRGKVRRRVDKKDIAGLRALLLPSGTPHTPMKFAIRFRYFLSYYNQVQAHTKEMDALIEEIVKTQHDRLKKGMSELLKNMICSPSVPLTDLGHFILVENRFQSVDEKNADIKEALAQLRQVNSGRAEEIEKWWKLCKDRKAL